MKILLYTACRCFVAFMILSYGFSKIMGSQFTILESELDKPMREVSGFWLTWYYFGYSKVYGTLIACVQVAGGLLLLFRKTTILGSAVLFAVLGNIVVVDIFYDIGGGALQMAVFLEACLAFILWQHREELVRVFWPSRNQVYEGERLLLPSLLKAGIRIAFVVVPLVLAYWLANYNNRRPTPLDGRWRVVSASQEAVPSSLPTHVYFERNRAWLCVFRYPSSWAGHHFEVSPRDHGIEIWDRWLEKGDRVFSGKYKLEGSTLSLRGDFHGAPLEMTLEKRE